MALLDKLIANRRAWLDLGGGLSVLVERPSEKDLAKVAEQGISHDAAIASVKDWKGFSEATFLGSAIGSADEIPFDQSVWAEACADKAEWLGAVAGEVIRLITEHLKKRDTAAKN